MPAMDIEEQSEDLEGIEEPQEQEQPDKYGFFGSQHATTDVRFVFYYRNPIIASN